MAGARCPLRFGTPWSRRVDKKKNVDGKRNTGGGRLSLPHRGWLTGNTCIVGLPPPAPLPSPPLVFRRRCTRSVYSRDFLEGAPFEGVPFSGEQSPAAFSRFSKSSVAGIIPSRPLVLSSFLYEQFCSSKLSVNIHGDSCNRRTNE